jgi:hypothetical protein
MTIIETNDLKSAEINACENLGCPIGNYQVSVLSSRPIWRLVIYIYKYIVVTVV